MTNEVESQPTVTKQTITLSVPLSIIIAGALIAAAVYFKGSAGSPTGSGQAGDGDTARGQGAAQPEAAPETVVGNFRAVDAKTDHIRGAQDAKVTVIEYADTECPFCKRFHPTLQQLIKEYPNDVRWVYRHFPLDALHSKARKESEATECAGDKFWAYLDRLYEVTPSNDGLDPAELPKIAEFVGLNRAQFEQCLSSGKYAQHVADDLADAESAGGSGTPYSVVIAASGEKFPLEGAQPYAAVKQLVEKALANK